MAPELAIDTLRHLATGSLVLDPMAGSGTVIRQATDLGHQAVGYDMDPLAVLMARVWTTPVEDRLVGEIYAQLLRDIERNRDPYLPWVDDDAETREFIDYWFAETQRNILRRIAATLHEFSLRRFSKAKHAAADVIRVALSRIIITKEQGASLARDTSHSRPHKVASCSSYDVLQGLDRSLRQVRKRLSDFPPRVGAQVSFGDARSMLSIENGEVDAVLTSPPYLNAIDYLRGHRMSLVWLGHRIADLRRIRSSSIGAERAPDSLAILDSFTRMRVSMGDIDELPARYSSMVDRYCEDLYRLASETSRVLRRHATATFVVGNSCLKGVFVRNSNALLAAASMCGLSLVKEFERDLPIRSRYLPITGTSSLGKRMRTETILVFQKT